jgi:diacylglycerol kinase family enzyme
MRIHGIINKRAGTLIGTDPQVFADRIRRAYAAAGHEVTLDVIEPSEICDRIDAAVKQNYDALLIGGGDGSINAAANRLMGKRTALGILPLGTMNRLARELEISLGLDQMAGELADAERVQIDVAEVNGNIFLCNSFIGLPPMITERRQSLRGKGFFERMAGYFRLPLDISRNMRRLALQIDDQQQQRVVRALTVVVSNNSYAEEPNIIPRRKALDEGTLGLYISRHYSLAQTVWLLIRAAFGQWHGDPRFERQQLHKLTINSRHSHLRIANDGELMKLKTPLNYVIRPKALTVLVPLKKAA